MRSASDADAEAGGEDGGVKASALLWVLEAANGDGEETRGLPSALRSDVSAAEEGRVGEVDPDEPDSGAGGDSPPVGVWSGEDEVLDPDTPDAVLEPSSSGGHHWSELMHLIGGLRARHSHRRKKRVGTKVVRGRD